MAKKKRGSKKSPKNAPKRVVDGASTSSAQNIAEEGGAGSAATHRRQLLTVPEEGGAGSAAPHRRQLPTLPEEGGAGSAAPHRRQLPTLPEEGGAGSAATHRRQPGAVPEEVEAGSAATHRQEPVEPEIVDRVEEYLESLSPLQLAVFNNQLELVKRLVTLACVNLEDRASDGGTSLFITCQQGFADIAEVLLDSGANIEAPNLDDVTPLLSSILHSKIDVFKVLLAHGANVKAVDNRNRNALHFAAMKDFPHSEIKKLISKGADVEGLNYVASTPLYYAARYGSISACKLLLENGANANSRSMGYTPLHVVSQSTVKNSDRDPQGPSLRSDQKRRLQTARLLLRHGADPNAVDLKGNTPLSTAIEQKELGIVWCLLNEGGADPNGGGRCNTMLHRTLKLCLKGPMSEFMAALLHKGANPNVTDFFGYTLAHLAARSCNVIINKLLLSNGALYDIGSIFGLLPIHASRRNYSNPEVLPLLKLVDRFFQSASNNNFNRVKECLATWDQLVLCCSVRYMSPLHHPVSNGWTSMVILLLKRGANPSATTRRYASPLHYAAKHNRLEAAIALLTHGARFDIAYGADNVTPLDVAEFLRNKGLVTLLESVTELFRDVQLGKPAVIRYLKTLKVRKMDRFVAYKNARNSQGLKLIDIARQNQLNEIVDFLS